MKRVRTSLFICSLMVSVCFVVYAREYIYPVATVTRDGNKYVYLIHQISLNQLQLLQWDTQTKVVIPALASSITPAGIKMLPDNTGYSFIDQDSLYIKFFSKRSPVKIDIHQPIHQLDIIQWIDSTTCYFAARHNQQFSIYQLSAAGALDVVLRLPDADCLYPQKIDSELYYIQRSFGKKNYSIRHAQYTLSADDAHIKHSDLMHNNYDQPIAFLHMISSMHGFYISYPASVESQASCLPCSYHQIQYDSAAFQWNTQKLFDFNVPLDFILPDSDDRLHESLLPLLPKPTQNGIYYCDCARDAAHTQKQMRNLEASWYEAECVKIYFYDFLTQKSTIKTSIMNQDSLAPLPIENTTLYGHSMAQPSKNKELLPGMWRNDYGQMCYEVPQIKY